MIFNEFEEIPDVIFSLGKTICNHDYPYRCKVQITTLNDLGRNFLKQIRRSYISLSI